MQNSASMFSFSSQILTWKMSMVWSQVDLLWNNYIIFFPELHIAIATVPTMTLGTHLFAVSMYH